MNLHLPGATAAPQPQPPLESYPNFGPSCAETIAHQALLRRAAAGDAEMPFDLRENAVTAACDIDWRFVEAPVELGKVGAASSEATLQFFHRLHIASSLGLVKGNVALNPEQSTLRALIRLPEPGMLPPRPAKTSISTFVDAKGQPVDPGLARTIFAAHYVAQNAELFEQEGAFAAAFDRVVADIERDGALVFNQSGETYGPSTSRRYDQPAFYLQVAGALGYVMGKVHQQPGGTLAAVARGVRPGFEHEGSRFAQVGQQAARTAIFKDTL